jgi:hypothetical protein
MSPMKLFSQRMLGKLGAKDETRKRYFSEVVGIEAPRGMIMKVKEIVMLILAWIVLGLIVGFIASKLAYKTGEGVFMNIVFGIAGAMFGGELITPC